MLCIAKEHCIQVQSAAVCTTYSGVLLHYYTSSILISFRCFRFQQHRSSTTLVSVCASARNTGFPTSFHWPHGTDISMPLVPKRRKTASNLEESYEVVACHLRRTIMMMFKWIYFHVQHSKMKMMLHGESGDASVLGPQSLSQLTLSYVKFHLVNDIMITQKHIQASR